MGMEKPAPGQYLAHHLESGAVSGAAGRDFTAGNRWLVGAWLSAFISLRRAGLKVAMPRELAAWDSFPLLWLPSPLTSTEMDLVHVHSDFWEKARQYVWQGGTLYASLCADAAIPEMAGLFGASMVDHDPFDEIMLTFQRDFGDLKKGEVLRYQPVISNPKHLVVTLELAGGEVIAADQKGRPALVANGYGQGHTLLCAYPLEAMAAVTPAAFEGREDTWRIYRALADQAKVQALFRSAHPAVEAGCLVGEGRGIIVLTNHSNKAVKTTLTSTQKVTWLARLLQEGHQAIDGRDGTWQVEVGAWDGAILEWTSPRI